MRDTSDDTNNEYKFYRKDFEALLERCEMESYVNEVCKKHGFIPPFDFIQEIANFIDLREAVLLRELEKDKA